MAGCGEGDDCPHPGGLALDLEPLAQAEGRPERLRRLVDPVGDEDLVGDALSVTSVPAGGHVVGGLLEGETSLELFALSLDERHCVVGAWRQQLNSAGAEITSLLALPDGGLAVGGRTPGSGGSGDEEAWIARYRRDGEPLWTLVQGEFLYVSGLFDTPSREVVQALALLPDGRLAAAGQADVNEALYSNWLLLLQPDGHAPLRIDLPRDNPRIVGNIDSIALAEDGRIALAGTLAAGEPKADAWVLVLSAEGELLWDERFSESGRQTVAAAAWQGDDLVLAGHRGDEGDRDGWVLLLGPDGAPHGDAQLHHVSGKNESLHAIAAWADGAIAVGQTDSGSAAGGWLVELDRGPQLQRAIALPKGSFHAVAALADGGALAVGREAAGGPPLVLLLPP